MIEPWRESQSHLAHDLRPKMKGFESVFPLPVGQFGQGLRLLTIIISAPAKIAHAAEFQILGWRVYFAGNRLLNSGQEALDSQGLFLFLRRLLKPATNPRQSKSCG